MAKPYNPALDSDIAEIVNTGSAATSVDFKGLAKKLDGLFPASGPIVTQGQGHFGHPYAYGSSYGYGGGPAVINTKYGKTVKPRF